jgi:hypothetical protein
MRPIFCAVFVCTLSPTLWSQSLDPIDNYLTSASEKANDLVYNVGAAGRGVAMKAGQAALNAIGAFRAGYADSLKLTEGALTAQQAQTDKLQATVDTHPMS